MFKPRATLFILGFPLVTCFVWLVLNKRYPTSDSMALYVQGMDLAERITNADFIDLAVYIRRCFKLLLHSILASFGIMIGMKHHSVVLVENSFFYGLIVYFSFKLSSLFHGPITAALLAVGLSTMPYMVFQIGIFEAQLSYSAFFLGFMFSIYRLQRVVTTSVRWGLMGVICALFVFMSRPVNGLLSMGVLVLPLAAGFYWYRFTHKLKYLTGVLLSSMLLIGFWVYSNFFGLKRWITENSNSPNPLMGPFRVGDGTLFDVFYSLVVEFWSFWIGLIALSLISWMLDLRGGKSSNSKGEHWPLLASQIGLSLLPIAVSLTFGTRNPVYFYASYIGFSAIALSGGLPKVPTLRFCYYLVLVMGIGYNVMISSSGFVPLSRSDANPLRLTRISYYGQRDQNHVFYEKLRAVLGGYTVPSTVGTLFFIEGPLGKPDLYPGTLKIISYDKGDSVNWQQIATLWEGNRFDNFIPTPDAWKINYDFLILGPMEHLNSEKIAKDPDLKKFVESLRHGRSPNYHHFADLSLPGFGRPARNWTYRVFQGARF